VCSCVCVCVCACVCVSAPFALFAGRAGVRASSIREMSHLHRSLNGREGEEKGKKIKVFLFVF